MAELERIYKDTDTGGWGWVTQEATGGEGESLRFIRVDLKLNLAQQPNSSVGPQIWMPLLSTPAGGPVMASIPTKIGAGEHVAYVSLKTPNDGGDDVTVKYVELLAANLDWTEALTVYTEAEIVIPAGTNYVLSVADFSGSYAPVGADLSLFEYSGAGAIASAAGGVFSAQLAFDVDLGP